MCMLRWIIERHVRNLITAISWRGLLQSIHLDILLTSGVTHSLPIIIRSNYNMKKNGCRHKYM